MEIAFLVRSGETGPSCVGHASFQAVVPGGVQHVVRVVPFEVSCMKAPRLFTLDFLALAWRVIDLAVSSSSLKWEVVLSLFPLLDLPFALLSGFVLQVVFAAADTFVYFCWNYLPKLFIFHTNCRKFTYVVGSWKILNIHEAVGAVVKSRGKVEFFGRIVHFFDEVFCVIWVIIKLVWFYPANISMCILSPKKLFTKKLS